MVGANFEGFITSHDQTDLLCLSVLKKTGITCAPFFPLTCAGVKSEKLCAPRVRKVSYQRQCPINDGRVTETRLHLEDDVFVLFMSLCFYLLCEPDDWLKINIDLFFLL